MPVETTNVISGLDPISPAGSELQREGDNHIRLLKTVLQNVFPNASRAFRFPTTDAAKTSDYQVLSTDQNKVIPVSASTAPRTVTLPAGSADLDGFSVIIVISDASDNNVTVDGNGSDTINFDPTKLLTVQAEAIMCVWCQALGSWIGLRTLPEFNQEDLDDALDGKLDARENLEVDTEQITDWNNATASGWYSAAPGAANAPTADWSTGMVIAHDTNYVVQLAYTFTGTRIWYERVRQGGVWSAWALCNPRYTVSTSGPSGGLDGDFWFQIL